MARIEAKELPNIMKLPSRKPKSLAKDEIPHWKVWAHSLKNKCNPFDLDQKCDGKT